MEDEKVLTKAKALTDQQLLVLSKMISDQANKTEKPDKTSKRKIDVDFSYHVTSDAGTIVHFTFSLESFQKEATSGQHKVARHHGCQKRASKGRNLSGGYRRSRYVKCLHPL